MDSELLDRLLADQVVIMHAKGVFATNPRMIVPPEECPAKTIRRRVASEAGTISHIGDMPYDGITSMC